MRCEACGKRQFLEYPRNILQLRDVAIHEKVIQPGSFAYCCKHCKSTKLNRMAGEWVAHYPDRDIVGYAINQLMCPWISADVIEEKRRNYKFPQLFWNYVLGETYNDGGGMVSEAQIEACFNPFTKPSRRRTERWPRILVGIDWGHLNWMTILGKTSDTGKYELIGCYCVEDDVKEPLAAAMAFGDIMQDLDFDRCVADYGYGKDRVAYLVKRFPGRVYGCFYQEDSKLIVPSFSDAGYKVTVDRTASIQTLTNAIRNREFMFPTYEVEPLMATVSKHLQALFLQHEEDEKTGEIVDYVDSTGDDHFGHALNYARLAGSPWESKSGFSFDFLETAM